MVVVGAYNRDGVVGLIIGNNYCFHYLVISEGWHISAEL